MRSNIVVSTVVIAISVLLFAVPITKAATVGPYNCALTRTRTDWSKDCVFQQFNPSLGTLQNIVLTVSGNIITTLKVENLDSLPHTITSSLNGAIIINRPVGTSLTSLPITRSTTDSFGVFDGVEDYAGTSGKSYSDLTSSNSKTDTITAAADLTIFSGNGNVTIPVLAQASSTATGSGNVQSRHTTDADASVSVIYTYTPPPTPTPTVTPVVTSPPPTSTSSSSAPACNDTRPSCKPDLFQIDAGANYAKIYINPCKDHCGKVQILYGRTESADEYNTEMVPPTKDGVFTYTINSLDPNTKYYFKIRCMNGCSGGDTGDSLGATTSSCITSFYRTGSPQKGVCGTGGDEKSASIKATSTKSTSNVLGASTGSSLVAAGNTYIWLTAMVGSAIIAFIVTLKTSSFSVGFKSRRKSLK